MLSGANAPAKRMVFSVYKNSNNKKPITTGANNAKYHCCAVAATNAAATAAIIDHSFQGLMVAVGGVNKDVWVEKNET